VFAKFIATRANNAIILTRRTAGVADATLNLAVANGTAAGITEVVTSTDTLTSRNTSTGIVRNLILRGGTLINKSGADLTISGVTLLAAGNTNATVDSTIGQKVVLAADATYAARINSAAESSGALTVDGDLDLASQPGFSIFDDAATAELVPNGNKLVLIDYLNGSLSGTFAGLPDGAAVVVTKGDVTNNFVIDYNDPAYSNKAVTLTSTNAAAGDNYDSWAIDNNIPGEPFDEDFDNDGISNGVEYALGKNPILSDTPAGVLLGNTITFTKGAEAITNADVSWTIQTSETLVAGSWIDEPSATQPAGDPSLTIAYTFGPPTPPKKFARLKVVQVP
jgi:hypothetical protein